MKYAVVGTRSYNHYQYVQKYLDKIPNITEIISGEAGGIDTLAKIYAKNNNIPYKGHPAEWSNFVETPENPVKIRTNKFGDKYNVLAGPNRNTKIVADSDIIVAFYSGDEKSGTHDTVKKAIAAGKQVIWINILNGVVTLIDPVTKEQHQINLEMHYKKID
jgi:hypothetical protein